MAVDPDKSSTGLPAHARDVMTEHVISVPPDMSVGDIARLLLDKRVSAVPVVNAEGVPIGMVSEGDLIGRPEPERLGRVDWWLALVTGQPPLDDTFRKRVQAPDRTARDVMSAPLVTVSEDTDVSEIARLFAIHHIKRVPVLRDGHCVGIVSRADLLRVVVASHPDLAKHYKAKHGGFLAGLFGAYHLPPRETVAGIAAEHPPTPGKPGGGDQADRLAADDFRRLVEDFHGGEARHHEEARRAASEQRKQHARQLIDEHVFDEAWRQMLHGARVVAEHGEQEFLLIRFPNQLCLDGGRAINVYEPDWPMTLRGTPAEIYLRWERELKPRAFGLSARVLEFPDGKPGDIGLFLEWRGA